MEPGRRERKKNQTRKAIAEEAARLFGERGFEAVTIAEIADAADVAVGTVFNYFRSKEALFFDLADDLVARLAEAVRDLPPGPELIAAFRRWHDGELDHLLDPRGHERVRRFFGTIAASATLRAYEPQLYQRYQDALEHAMAIPHPGDPTPRLLAAQLVALHREVIRTCRDHVLRGAASSTLQRQAAAVTARAFSMLRVPDA
ncbi:TetR/AcrR family transcriptional regulator [Amycolatopsis sp. CA-230715]|uniref:TetR/AcrR family transcriptional regulator n=1 Tax=Amycolatopsis sp. CA-230715 TaxID=2745196 RepID=UPI001C03710B|nr:TetR/AcrR family transcriptional regulator [Amycolatopsis sp. CA-230715]QWF85405.1 hypothetical protein HUW46_08859 [Amycolatopsis sp. CA-230715]